MRWRLADVKLIKMMTSEAMHLLSMIVKFVNFEVISLLHKL